MGSRLIHVSLWSRVLGIRISYEVVYGATRGHVIFDRM